MSRPPLYTVEPLSSGNCMSRPPLYTVEPVSSGHCMSRPPLYTVEPVNCAHTLQCYYNKKMLGFITETNYK